MIRLNLIITLISLQGFLIFSWYYFVFPLVQCSAPYNVSLIKISMRTGLKLQATSNQTFGRINMQNKIGWEKILFGKLHLRLYTYFILSIKPSGRAFLSFTYVPVLYMD